VEAPDEDTAPAAPLGTNYVPPVTATASQPNNQDTPQATKGEVATTGTITPNAPHQTSSPVDLLDDAPSQPVAARSSRDDTLTELD